MPLVTNLCKKHKNAFPENECPFCVLEAKESALGASREFFTLHGRHKIEVVPGYVVRVEELYQHFRARLLEELSPIILKVEREQ